ncbi:alpha/beta hydrolase, partial [Mesorhizobium sp. M00.F.Ca.ET.217.01.1.1]
GTMQYPKYLGKLVQIVLKLITLITGKRRCLKWLNQIMYKTFNKNIKNSKSKNDWLSSDEQEVEKFEKDPYTGFLVSNQLIFETVKYMLQTSKLKNIKKMKSGLPILLISGKDDAIGNYGKGIRHLGKLYKKGNI